MNEREPDRGRGGARTSARGLECQVCRMAEWMPACSARFLSPDGGISLAGSKEEWKRFGCFPGRSGKISGLGQRQESPLASPFCPWPPAS